MRRIWKAVCWAELNLIRVPAVFAIVAALRLLAYLPGFSWRYEKGRR